MMSKFVPAKEEVVVEEVEEPAPVKEEPKVSPNAMPTMSLMHPELPDFEDDFMT